jgi:hypothetical protein
MGDITIDIDKIDEIDVNKIDFDKVYVDKNDTGKIFTFDDIDYELHNGKPITMIEISPNENYLITYSEEDSSIVSWDVEDINKAQLKFDQTIKINGNNKDDEDIAYVIESLCVSDDKKFAYIYRYNIYINEFDGK